MLNIGIIHRFFIKINGIYNYFYSIFMKWSTFFFNKQLVYISPEEQYTNKYNEKMNTMLNEKKILNTNIEKVFYDKQIDINNDTKLIKLWNSRILFEYTPVGLVIMFYDVKNKGFSYYSNTNIPYYILNSVAIKYIITFQCFDFFIDSSFNHTSQLFLIEKEKEKEYEEKNKKKLIFDTNKGPFIKKQKLKKVKFDDKSAKDENKSAKDEKIINKFLSLGKTYEFQIIPKQKRIYHTNNFQSTFLTDLDEEDKLQQEVLNYNDFKKLYNKTK